jgi:hypothetical protein
VRHGADELEQMPFTFPGRHRPVPSRELASKRVTHEALRPPELPLDPE